VVRVSGHGHGTHVSSTVVGANVGLARGEDIQLSCFKVFDQFGHTTLSALLEGINFAAGRAAQDKTRKVRPSVGG
jgi:hypothetical protein